MIVKITPQSYLISIIVISSCRCGQLQVATSGYQSIRLTSLLTLAASSWAALCLTHSIFSGYYEGRPFEIFLLEGIYIFVYPPPS